MEEIIDAVNYEIENSGYAEKLSAGLVITGGGALLRHLSQLVKFKTGLDVRIGFPNEHLSADCSEDINQPMYSTAIGLILKGWEQATFIEKKVEEISIKEVNITPEKKEEIRSTVKKSGIMDGLKKTLANMFEEKDMEM